MSGGTKRRKKKYIDYIKAKESFEAYIRSYLTYAVSFYALQVLDYLISGSSESFFNVIIIAETLILVLILLVLVIFWLFNLGLCHKKNQNEVIYAKTISAYDETLGITTKLIHPEIDLHGEMTPFWGWGNDGTIRFVSDNSSGDIYVKKLPETNTEEKNLVLKAVSRGLAEEENQKAELRMSEQKQRGVSAKADLFRRVLIYPFFVDENNRLLRGAGGEIIRTAITLSVELLEADGSIGEKAVKACIGKGYRNFGIISIFDIIDSDERGLLMMIQLDSALAKENAVPIKSGSGTETKSVKGKAVTEAEDIDYEELASLINGDAPGNDDTGKQSESSRALDRYAALMYMRAKLDEQEFADVLVNYLKKTSGFSKQKNSSEACDIQRSEYRQTFGRVCRDVQASYRRFRYKLILAIKNNWNFGTFMLVLLLEHFVEPAALGSAKQSPEQNLFAVFFNAMVENFSEQSQIFLVIVLALLGLWLLAKFIFNKIDVENDVSSRFVCLRSLINNESGERTWKVGENNNITPAKGAIRGWNGDNIMVNLASETWNRDSQPQLMAFQTPALANEPNDGDKYRMIGFFGDEGDFRLSIDLCKYTDTMRVRNMVLLREAYQQKELFFAASEIGAKGTTETKKSERGIDIRKVQSIINGILRYNNKPECQSSEEFAAALDEIYKGHEKDYDNYLDAMKNLRLRVGGIDLSQLPPNSLCMHAIIMTSDNYIVKTTRKGSVAYYPGRKDSSAEEQLNKLDFVKDGFRLQNWAERLLEEEFGITGNNCHASEVGKIIVESIFIEENCLNMSLAVIIHLNMSKKQLSEVLRYWPRKDNEFDYSFCKIGPLWEEYKETSDYLNNTSIVGLSNENSANVHKGKDSYHPTAINRIFLAACYLKRYDIAEEILAEPALR